MLINILIIGDTKQRESKLDLNWIHGNKNSELKNYNNRIIRTVYLSGT
jgi:hypothetical protein